MNPDRPPRLLIQASRCLPLAILAALVVRGCG